MRVAEAEVVVGTPAEAGVARVAVTGLPAEAAEKAVTVMVAAAVVQDSVATAVWGRVTPRRQR